MNTVKLFYENAYTREFDARVLSCEPSDGRWAVTLDRTAFFPEEGGQTADGGTLSGAEVLDVQIKSGIITHYTATPLPVGATVHGVLDWAERFRKMQNHTAEHLLCGLVHARFGYENVGFNLGADGFLFDVSGELDDAALAELENNANAVIWENRAVRAWFPDSEALAAMEYRSKLDLTEDVRIVEIEGADRCACCAPHVARTGEIGYVKILDAMRHRGGMRIRCKAGLDALRDHQARCAADGAVSRMLSVPQGDIAAGVSKLLAERDGLKQKLSEAQAAAIQAQIASLTPTDGDLLLFADCDTDALRTLVNAGMTLCGGVCAAFGGADGDWRFVMGSRTQDCREKLNRLKQTLPLRGGGKPDMVSGSCTASRADIESCF